MISRVFMKKFVLLLFVSSALLLPYAYAQDEAQKEKEPQKARWSLGLDLADTTTAFFEPDGVHVPVSLVAGFDFTDNFQAHTSQIVRFPMRGGYVYIPTIGLRAHSNSIYGVTFFLSGNLGYKVTNVPWLTSGFLMQTHVGSRYVFSFKMYVEGGIGGNFEISANKMGPSYFLSLGYML